jgi:hypothetical protein
MSRKLKIKKRKARDKMINLIRKVLKEHPRRKPKKDGSGTRITPRTGNLFKEIKPEIKIGGDKIGIEVRMMDYYQWLDGGTSKMDGWFFSEEIMNSKEIADISEELIGDALDDVILDMISNINKK